MVQIKLFRDRTPDMEKFEKLVNTFLSDNKDTIIVKDIKYTADYPNPHNSAWQNWTVMVIYETVESKAAARE
ncbi:MAG: hypothetical protein IJY64_03955 [Bacteroidaceae bacterium]|nr:hypothetical protein [Bacteroidaceae bacterium]